MVLVNRKACSSEKSRRGCKIPDRRRNTTVLDKPPLPFPGHIEINKSGKSHYNSILTTWAESFIFAGSSALLLLLSNLFSVYWYFSFFALVPFLYRIIKATPTESLRLGILFGISFFAVSVTDSLPVAPIPTLLKLLLGTGLFAVFGWTVGWARKHWGFYPSIVAVLWVGLEIGLTKIGFAGGILGKAEFSNPFLHGLIGLFGFIIVSAIIVLLNSLLVLAIAETIKLTTSKKKNFQEGKRSRSFPFTRNFHTKKVFIVPEGRGPPIVSSSFFAMRVLVD